MKIPQSIESWFKSRTASKVMRLKNACVVTEEFRRHTGGKDIYGRVTLRAAPADVLEFESLVTWPHPNDQKETEEYIFSAILRRALLEEYFPVLGMKIVLEEIGWDHVNSCPIGYYSAASAAMGKILRPDPLSQNYEAI